MGYIFTYKEAQKYDDWFQKKKNELFFETEKNIMFKMLNPIKKATVLDIGCGTGKSTEALIEKNLDVSAIEPSVYMFDIAKNKIGNKAELIKGFAEDLPFNDNHFNYSVFFFSLEFTDNYKKALSEAFRVTKDKVFIFTINKYSIYRLLHFNNKKINFFSSYGLRKDIYNILGKVPIEHRMVNFLKREFFLMDKNPFAALIAMTVVPVPKIKMTPLSLKILSKSKMFSATPKPI